MAAQTKKAATANGNADANPDPLSHAIAYETTIALEAREKRGDATVLTPVLFMDLLPLLRRPIPAGFIVTTPITKGKPYLSTGITSVQVQIDRMDNVLTPMWWGYSDEYEQDGKLCRVRVWVGDEATSGILAERVSYGGVNLGSTIGNLYKGSFTNAAKRALALLGPGHEVYLGATDYDPDVNPDAAAEQAKDDAPQGPRKLTGDEAVRVEKAVADAGLADVLPHRLRAFGVKSTSEMTTEQALALRTWIDERVAAREQES